MLPRCSPTSMLKAPAPPPNPYPLGPYLRAWQTLQKSSFSWVLALVESNILLHRPGIWKRQKHKIGFRIQIWLHRMYNYRIWSTACAISCHRLHALQRRTRTWSTWGTWRYRLGRKASWSAKGSVPPFQMKWPISISFQLCKVPNKQRNIPTDRYRRKIRRHF